MKKKIFLTFDDGPIPGLTDWLLDLLAEKEVRATFFCVGQNIKKHPELFQRIVNEGHAVGNHSFNHLNGFETPRDVYLKNIQITDDAIEELGIQTDLFRPPYMERLKYTQEKN